MTTETTPRRAAAAAPPARRSAVRLVPAAAQALIGAGAAAIVGLWWSDTTSVVGAAGWLTDAGRITGLLAGYACAVLLALMARVPLLDHGVGTDRLARWHAMGGRYTVCLASAHVLLIIWGYSLTSHTSVVSQTGTLVLHYPEMLKGTIGFLLLLATGVVSARAARRRMRYETWYHLHFATYLAVFLVFGHQLANGADFVGNRALQLAWYAMYLTIAALLVWFRFVVPVRRTIRHRLRVAAVHPEAPGIVSVYLTGRRLDELTVRPGQFFRWRFLAPGMWWAANPYSLSAPAGSGSLRITVKAVGTHSAALAHLAPGTRVWAEGPYGGFTQARASGDKALLIAGGVGITPLRTLFETLPGEVTLMYRARSARDLALRGELDALAAERGTRVLYALDDAAGPHALPLTARALLRAVPDLTAHDVYLCGPPAMTAAATRALRAAGVARGRIHHESFAF
ncbi:ferredoxin reductase family protein [Streptomyces montanisoli]|uniref:Ferric reductase-like transmembrane domain-containing protein n=1 Tax=Streptomyces montanisoli TaxID=2798581 RepID=A0A940RUR9_9ACTN|nr:ferredoxin reductase family protein [Streptomyces montanisoli]MBP0457510.1 ferric reductase-like transmembrane domain-containing protein [Streptomyces montanisoli]